MPTPNSRPTGSPEAPGTAEIASLTYEQARDRLAATVARLESGSPTLEESLTLWEQGEALAARCQEWLDGARRRLAAATGADPEPDRPDQDDVTVEGGTGTQPAGRATGPSDRRPEQPEGSDEG